MIETENIENAVRLFPLTLDSDELIDPPENMSVTHFMIISTEEGPVSP